MVGGSKSVPRMAARIAAQSTRIGCNLPLSLVVLRPGVVAAYQLDTAEVQRPPRASAARLSSRNARSRSAASRSGAISGRLPAGSRRPLILVKLLLKWTDESGRDSTLRRLSSSISPTMAMIRAISLG